MPIKSRTRRERKPPGGDREGQIIEVATRIFQDRGYEATTIQAIADEVGLLKGSLYYYIDTKEDLLFQIIQEVHRGLRASVEQAEAVTDPIAGIEAFIHAHVRFCAENLPAIHVFLHDFGALSEERHGEIIKERDAYNRRLRDLIADAQKQGLVRADLDLDLMVLSIFGMMNWMYQWYRPGGRRKPNEIAETFTAITLSGIQAS